MKGEICQKANISNESGQEGSSNIKSSKIVPIDGLEFERYFYSDFEDVGIERKANCVYDSPVFKNTLAISKGKPRKGFKVDDLPIIKIYETSKDFKDLCFDAKTHHPENTKEDYSLEFKGRTRAEILAQASERTRKTSFEILCGLQNKLHESRVKIAAKNKRESKSKKVIIIDEN